jgi:NAD-dependent deacetylase
MRVLVLTGAGVSAESGIPTFRGKEGYWRNLDPMKLATPQAFERDPQLVWQWYRERREGIRNARPNAAHEAIARLCRDTDEFLLVTQNVDDLHMRAGMAACKTVQIHGDIFVTRCSRCQFERHDYEHEERTAADFGGLPHDSAVGARTSLRVPKCPQCDALMRPGVVWFGEQLPMHELRRVGDFLDEGACDIVIVAGTTATFGYILDWAIGGARDGGELIEVNPEETPLSRFATQLVREPAAIALPRIVDHFTTTQ